MVEVCLHMAPEGVIDIYWRLRRINRFLDAVEKAFVEGEDMRVAQWLGRARTEARKLTEAWDVIATDASSLDPKGWDREAKSHVGTHHEQSTDQPGDSSVD